MDTCWLDWRPQNHPKSSLPLIHPLSAPAPHHTTSAEHRAAPSTAHRRAPSWRPPHTASWRPSSPRRTCSPPCKPPNQAPAQSPGTPNISSANHSHRVTTRHLAPAKQPLPSRIVACSWDQSAPLTLAAPQIPNARSRPKTFLDSPRPTSMLYPQRGQAACAAALPPPQKRVK